MDRSAIRTFGLGFLLILSGAIPTFSQHIVKSDKIWSFVDTVGYLSNRRIVTTSYKFGEDTLVNGKVYKKVLRTTDSTQSDGWIYFGRMMREDSMNHVFLTYGRSEHLLYDFDHDVDDTIIRPINGAVCRLVVLDIDTIQLLDGGSGKRLTLGGPWTVRKSYWIEHIGSSRSLSDFFEYCSSSKPPRLSCVWEDSELIYSSGVFSRCIVTSTSQKEPLTPRIVKTLLSKGDGLVIENAEEARVRVYDLQGALLHDVVYPQDVIYLRRTGFMIVEIIDGDRRWLEKIVVH